MCTQSQLESIKSGVYRAAAEIFGDRLEAVVLYGSYARGDYDSESDIDFMICVSCDPNALNNHRAALSTAMSKLGLKNDILISTIITDKKRYDKYRQTLPLYKSIETEGIEIYA